MPQKEQAIDQLRAIRHSLSHILAMAVLEKFPKAELGIGPVIENGFYYDFKLPLPLTDADLPELEKTMHELIAQILGFSGEATTPLKAKKIFKDQPFKIELIKDFVKEKKELTVYATCPPHIENWKLKIGNCFLDLCRGGHVANTLEINPDAFKLTHVAGAYWKGSEKNPMLTRIYGLAFLSKEELNKHLVLLEEARRRDHKKLGPELDLFTFSELVGSGLPLWTPKGTIVRNILDDFVWQLRKKKGYEQVDIPHLTKKDLYEKSGHWDKFRDELFKSTTREGHLFAIKPMNCPHHTQIYARRQWSWRDLPQRYANTTKVYRDEQTGELGGLAPRRGRTPDDAHVFCRQTQVKNEILSVWDIVTAFYRAAGFELFIRLSLHDPDEPKKYLGTPEIWKRSEQILREIAKEKGSDAAEAIGEAAFYGPKIDFLAHDSLGREWQVATIQLDMNMPERFDLFCINEKGEQERIVMIHAAIMGSIERFIAIMLEHTNGNLPLWLAPAQIKLFPGRGLRVEIDGSDETVGKKTRSAVQERVPYILVIGDKEASTSELSIRVRG